MVVRTTRIDVLALARAQGLTSSRTRSGGGGGSFGMGLAPGISGFEFDPAGDALTVGHAAGVLIGYFKVDQEDAEPSLQDDAGGKVAILYDEDGLVQIEGYYTLVTGETAIGEEGDEITFTIRFTSPTATQDNTRTLTVQAGDEEEPPVSYDFTLSNDMFNTEAADGDVISAFYADDDRVEITGLALTDDSEGRFQVVNDVNIARTTEAVEDATTYNLVADITFSDGHLEEAYTFTLTSFTNIP